MTIFLVIMTIKPYYNPFVPLYSQTHRQLPLTEAIDQDEAQTSVKGGVFPL